VSKPAYYDRRTSGPIIVNKEIVQFVLVGVVYNERNTSIRVGAQEMCSTFVGAKVYITLSGSRLEMDSSICLCADEKVQLVYRGGIAEIVTCTWQS